MPKQEEEDDYDEEQEDNEGEKIPEYNYEEMDETTSFKKWEKKIWDEYQAARTKHYEEQEDAEQQTQGDEEETDSFGLQEWIEALVSETYPGFDINRVKLVTTLGVCLEKIAIELTLASYMEENEMNSINAMDKARHFLAMGTVMKEVIKKVKNMEKVFTSIIVLSKKAPDIYHILNVKSNV